MATARLISIILSIPASYGLPIITINEVSPTCDVLGKCRTLQSIVFSCLSVIYLCAWVSLHVDIPKPGRSSISRLFGRALAFVLMTVVPETCVHLAFQQYLTASRWSREHGRVYGKLWSMQHGWLVAMGGFALKTGEGEYDFYRLTGRQLHDFLKREEIRLPWISTEEIKDRSKTTSFAKFVVLVQTGNFVISLIARRVEGIPLIPLEVFTLAFTLVTFVIYVTNWNKPYEMQMPFFVEVCCDPAVDVYAYAKTLQAEHPLPNPDTESPLSSTDGPMRTLTYALSDYVGLFDPHFIYFHTQDSRRKRVLSALLLEVVVLVFSAMHFLAWNLDFPTPLCKCLWRICTIVSTATSLLGMLAIAAFASSQKLGPLRMFVDGTLILTYAFCRAVLILLTMWTVAYLPAGAYRATSWTSLVPHL